MASIFAKETTHTVTSLLSRDYGCDHTCFEQVGVHIVIARDLPGRRRFKPRSAVLDIATMGSGVVVACSPERLAWARTTLGSMGRDDVFSPLAVWLLQEYVAEVGQSMYGPELKFVCSPDSLVQVRSERDIDLELVPLEGLADMFAAPGFPFSYAYDPHGMRPDVLATVARVDGHLVGIAGASADCDEMWQIGVEVLPDWQGRGIGRALVSRLTSAVLTEGRLPYYTTLAGNIASSRLAISLGFGLAWTEMYAR